MTVFLHVELAKNRKVKRSSVLTRSSFLPWDNMLFWDAIRS